MEVTVSENYQVVIPKAARKKLGIVPGQKINVTKVGTRSITFERSLTMQEILDKSAKTMSQTPWAKQKVDAAVWLRQQRDQE
jgi:AbrB family looped-hinge helix DNA binding protein